MNSINVTQLLEKLNHFVSRPILFALLGILCVIFGVASFVLMFHWNKYAVDKSTIVTAQAIYFLGGVLIMIVALVSVILY